VKRAGLVGVEGIGSGAKGRKCVEMAGNEQ